MLHTIVGFVADFSVRDDGEEPAGRELAGFIHHELTKTGLNTTAPQNRDNWAWDLFTTEANLKVTTIVGIVDDMDATPPRQWLVTADCPIPFLKRLFGGKQMQAHQQLLLRRLCEAIHNAMRLDSRFSHVTWYRADTFDKPGDVPSNQP